jgi:hypothetical protein
MVIAVLEIVEQVYFLAAARVGLVIAGGCCNRCCVIVGGRTSSQKARYK